MYARLFLILLALFSLDAKAQTIQESVAFAIIGEPKYAAGFSHFDYVNPRAPKGGTLTLAAIGTFDNFNRYALRGNPAVRTEALYDTLFTTSDDEPGSYYPLIAERARYAEDYSWMEIALNPRARFHDGTRITARDVAFTFNKFMTEGVPQFRLFYKGTTLWAIITINFFIVQIAPGGPVDQAIAAIEFNQRGGMPGAGDGGMGASHARTGAGNISEGHYRGGRGLDPEVIAEITHRYGFDKPLHERYLKMLGDYLRFDFGDSLFRSASVLQLIKDSLPVSVSLGLWSTLIIYLVSIPLGIRKAVSNGSRFDIWSSTLIIIGYAIPAFLFAILLIVIFAGGSYFDLFPLRGLVSPNFDTLPWYQKILDYLWHITLPVLATVIGGFAALTMLTKNSFLDEIRKQYVVTARAKGVGEKQILWGHVFRNAMLLVIAGFPATFISMFFTGSLLIEVMFSLNGLGLLGYEATVSRDYPVMFGTLYIFTLIGLLLNIVSDISYTLVDPRIDFEGR